MKSAPIIYVQPYSATTLVHTLTLSILHSGLVIIKFRDLFNKPPIISS